MIAKERLEQKGIQWISFLNDPQILLPELKVPIGTKVLRRFDLPTDNRRVPILKLVNKFGSSPVNQQSLVVEMAGVIQEST